jgi:hypothetical protein
MSSGVNGDALLPFLAASMQRGASELQRGNTPWLETHRFSGNGFRAKVVGGEGGIRTLEAGFSHLRDFQSRSFGQLGHLSVFRFPGTSPDFALIGSAVEECPRFAFMMAEREGFAR